MTHSPNCPPALAPRRTQERQAAALRLLAHAAVLHLVGQAAGTALGATAAERLGLLQRRAAAAYHEYPEQVCVRVSACARVCARVRVCELNEYGRVEMSWLRR